ncbi:MAG: c-type cytochrome [Acidobacteriota bacterium]
MKNFNRRLLPSALALLLSASSLPTADAVAPPGDPVQGKVVYDRYCVSCHGVEGDGRGEGAGYIFPKPRDFRQGTFKWRSTPSGALPSVADLDKTIRDGLYGTNMPTWYVLGERNRMNVISYIMTFSPRWQSEEIPAAITIPAEPPLTSESVDAGRALFEKLQCAQCHGDAGKGDGPSSHEQRNDWGDPITPADLTVGHFKGGGTPSDIYRVFMTGLNGAPMPSFADSIQPAEAWDLVHFIESLSAHAAPNPQFGVDGVPIHR